MYCHGTDYAMLTTAIKYEIMGLLSPALREQIS